MVVTDAAHVPGLGVSRSGPMVLASLGRAGEALRWLDHVVRRSPWSSCWARTVLIREAWHAARLDGVPATLVEVLHHLLPRGHAVEADAGLFPHVRAAREAIAGLPKVVVPEPLERVLVSTDRRRLPWALTRAGLLSGPWLPFTGWLVDHPDALDGSDPATIALLADGIAETCHTEIALLDDLHHLHTRLLGRLPSPTRHHRTVLHDLAGRGMVNARDPATRHGTTDYGRSLYSPRRRRTPDREPAVTHTIRLRAVEFAKAMTLAGYRSDYALSQTMGLNRSTVTRVRTGHLNPGPAFIAGALIALAPMEFHDLFNVIHARPRRTASTSGTTGHPCHRPHS
ncbi:hypothetical protein GCM10022243_08100 [Saccharothrix violaceirubra]|uniref:Uncharacterized protein n=1 Tax=Saccharothrix violaceirubra TaxID=413306 RepID=A0A7W7SZJ6_9PSEU|nr:hypothetical protein [Saccharothrix violaceirubra]MBB4963222.1 hypothetical protein [Saccharothrix violaceirubra]